MLTLSGPCRQTNSFSPDALTSAILGTGTGVCEATVTLADGGATYSTDITFATTWYACGSNPHGCGYDFEADATTWAIDNACADAGLTDAMADAASE